MKRVRIVLGFIAGAILLASSAAHSLLGWKQLSAALAKAQAPPDLVLGLAIGWHFAGAAMLAFGCIVLLLFTDVLRGRAVSLRPSLVIALVYVAFGSWAFAVSKLNPFFLVFIVPGLMLLAAWWPPGGATLLDSQRGRANPSLQRKPPG